MYISIVQYTLLRRNEVQRVCLLIIIRMNWNCPDVYWGREPEDKEGVRELMWRGQ